MRGAIVNVEGLKRALEGRSAVIAPNGKGMEIIEDAKVREGDDGEMALDGAKAEGERDSSSVVCINVVRPSAFATMVEISNRRHT